MVAAFIIKGIMLNQINMIQKAQQLLSEFGRFRRHGACQQQGTHLIFQLFYPLGHRRLRDKEFR